MTAKLIERLNKLKQLEDDVRHYSGNEASGYAEIARQKAELFDELASGHTALLRANATLAGALDTCAKTFRRYGELHRAKGTTEGNLKASNNDDLAEFCEGVLSDAALCRPLAERE